MERVGQPKVIEGGVNMQRTKDEMGAIRREVERLAQAVATDARSIAFASREGTGDGADALSLEIHVAQLRATRDLVEPRAKTEATPQANGHVHRPPALSGRRVG
jgi:hypothetical protein